MRWVVSDCPLQLRALRLGPLRQSNATGLAAWQVTRGLRGVGRPVSLGLRREEEGRGYQGGDSRTSNTLRSFETRIFRTRTPKARLRTLCGRPRWTAALPVVRVFFLALISPFPRTPPRARGVCAARGQLVATARPRARLTPPPSPAASFAARQGAPGPRAAVSPRPSRRSSRAACRAQQAVPRGSHALGSSDCAGRRCPLSSCARLDVRARARSRAPLPSALRRRLRRLRRWRRRRR